MNIATTSEQSTRLAACEVDPKTADMYYQPSLTLYGKRKGGKMIEMQTANNYKLNEL